MKIVFLSAAALLLSVAPTLSKQNCAGEGAQRRCYDTQTKEFSYGKTQSYNTNDPNLDRNRKSTPLYTPPGQLNKIPMQ